MFKGNSGMFLWLVLIFCCCTFLRIGAASCDDNDIAFYGGYLSIEWQRNSPNSNSFRKITVNFMPTYEVGVLFFIEFNFSNSKNLVSMISYNHSSLIFSIQQPSLHEDLIIASGVSSSSHNTLQLQIRKKVLRINLNSEKWSTQRLKNIKSKVSVENLLFGGAKDFTAYRQFPIRSYFVGNLTKFNMGSNCINLVKRSNLNTSQAVLQNHCTTVISPFVKLNAFSLPLTTVAIKSVSHLRINFTIATKQCVGELLHLSGGNFMLEIAANKFMTTITNISGHSAICTSTAVIDQSGWVNVMLTYVNDTVKYVINDEESGSCYTDLGTVNFTGAVIIGTSKNTSVPFVGSLRHLYWNESEINVIGLAKTDQQSCVGIGVSSCNSREMLSPSCLTCALSDLPIYWAGFDVSVESNLTVNEGEKSIINGDLNLSYTGPQCLTGASLQKLHKNIVFTIKEPYPVHGNLTVSNFTFEDVDKKEVYYYLSNAVEGSDVINLLIQVHCGDELLFEKYVNIHIRISVNDMSPYLELTNEPYTVVVGTRRVITRDVILMRDSDTPLKNVYCTATIVGQRDNMIGQFEWTDRPGYGITGRFNQYDINAGRIALRLFLNATGTWKIALTVSDAAINNHGNFEVRGVGGMIRVMNNKPLMVIENYNASIDTSHLVANTSFSNQEPIVMYKLSGSLKFGELLIVHNQSFTEREVSHFTQNDIDNRKLYYVHTVNIQNTTIDCFDFQLMVDDLQGDNGKFCVSIIIEDHLPKLVLNMTPAHNITLLEGEEKSISNKDLAITAHLESLRGQITQLPDDVIILLSFIELPKYGTLYFNNSNDNKTVVGLGYNVSFDQFAAGVLTYDHEIDEEHQDSFKIRLIAQNFSHLHVQPPSVSAMEYVIFIDVTPVNNKHPQIQIYSNLTITEGSHRHLTSDIVNITDADKPAENLTVHVVPKVAVNGSWFALLKNNSVAIDKFSVTEMSKGQVIFVHRLGAELETDYSFVVSDGLHNSSKEFKVIATPFPLNVDTTYSIKECSLDIDLYSTDLNFTDRALIHDKLFNVNLKSGDVQINTSPDSSIYISNSSGFVPVTSFYMRDIDRQRVFYVIKDNKTRIDRQQFGLSFSVGHAKPVYVEFLVCLSLLPYPELDTSSSLHLSLPEHGDIAISSSELFSTNTRRQSSLSDVRYKVVVSPTSGQLVMRDSHGPIVDFTQNDINEGKIRYYNHNYSSSGDKFTLTLFNKFYEDTANITISITIFLLRLKVVNNGFRVKEGGEHVIVKNELYATGPPGYSIMFFINSKPVHGKIILTTSHLQTVTKFSKENLDAGQVVYSNDDEEFYYDSMEIRIEATPGTTTPPHIKSFIVSQANTSTTYIGTVKITIDLVNDHAPELWKRHTAEVVQGHSVNITRYIISYQDDDIDMNISYLIYTVMVKPLHGHLFFNHNKSIANRFLQQHIYDLDIAYQSNNKAYNTIDTIDTCALEVSDGEKTEIGFLAFKIVPYTVEPVKNQSLSLDEGGRKTLLAKNLLFNATKANPPAEDSEYVYSITRHPILGKLVTPNSCNCNFTQEELKNGSVVYEHYGSDTTKDNFTFVVTVRGYTSTVMTFIININPVDDEAPTVVYSKKLVLNFSDRIYFNKSILEAKDSEADLYDLVFNVVKAPKFGSIKRGRDGNVTSSFTQVSVNEQAIFYQHENEAYDEWIDNISLSLSDGKNMYSGHIVITFILLPEVLPIKVNGIELIEGYVVSLSTKNIQVVHPYLSAFEMYVNVTQPVKYGKLLSFHEPYTMYFNSTELKNNSILYFYQEDFEVIRDSFKFVATVNGLSSSEHTFVFTIISLNDEYPVIIRSSVISLWAGEVTAISPDHLFTNDSDKHPADKLRYIITTNTSLGHFAYKEANHTPITTFSQDDIVDGAVIFVSTPTSNNTILEVNFTVTDGVNNVISYITFDINVLTITVDAQAILVAMGADQPLKFSAQTNDDSVKREFYYQVSVRPKLGEIINLANGLTVTNFTQEQINNRQIIYKHTAIDFWEADDIVNFTIFTNLARPVQTYMNVTIGLKQSSTSYLAASGSLNVDEGGTVCLNESLLDASNVLYKVWKNSNRSVGLREGTIQYVIVSPTLHGKLKIGNVSVGGYFKHGDIKSSDGVCYHHDGSESTDDSFSVTINISYNSTDIWYSNSTVVAIPIHISPLNDEDPVLIKFVKKIYVFPPDNYAIIIQPNELCIVDEDTADDKLVYIIVPGNQSMVMCSLSGRPTLNFTQVDINNGKVKCKLSSFVFSSTLTFNFTDGNFVSPSHVMYFSKVILKLTVVHNVSKLCYSQKDGLTGVVLTNAQLNSSTTGYRDDTTYKVTSPPNYGDLMKVNHSRVVTNFTQLDIDNKIIQYIATSKASYNDSFTVEVTNRHAKPLNVTIHFTAMAMIETNNTRTLTFPSVNSNQTLPVELFNITALVNLSNSDPIFTVINTLYGHLDLKSKKRSSDNHLFNFTGSQFTKGNVLYVLDENISNGRETIQLSVVADNMQTGFAEVSFNIYMLPTITVTSDSSPTTQPLESNTPPGYHEGSGFTLFALVPIIGIPCFILIVVLILVGFWYSQKLKQKKRSAAARGSSAICMRSQFNLPAGHHTMITTDIDHVSEWNSDHSSSNSDEGISMAMPAEDDVEDESTAQRYTEEHFRSRPVMDHAHYHLHHPLTSVRTSCRYDHDANDHELKYVKFPILKNEEYWL